MDFEELNDFADWEGKRRESAFKKTSKEMVFADSMKLAEEVGEFMNEIQKKLKLQRASKLTESEEEIEKHLAEEYADIILVASILAKRLGIDIHDAIEKKINIVRARKYE